MNRMVKTPLDQLPPGADARVCQLGGGKTFANRLASMGLSLGSRFKVLQNRGQGPVLVLVRDTRIALGRGEAMKILTEEPSDGGDGSPG
jgi:ferrous iron transport protein A